VQGRDELCQLAPRALRVASGLPATLTDRQTGTGNGTRNGVRKPGVKTPSRPKPAQRATTGRSYDTIIRFFKARVYSRRAIASNGKTRLGSIRGTAGRGTRDHGSSEGKRLTLAASGRGRANAPRSHGFASGPTTVFYGLWASSWGRSFLLSTVRFYPAF